MSLPLTVRLPIDPDGNNPNNYVAKEEHTLTNRPNRLFKPNYGSFYTASLEVYDMATSQRLKRGTDYICTQPRNIAIAKYGLEACSFIIIINPQDCGRNKVHFRHGRCGFLFGKRNYIIVYRKAPSGKGLQHHYPEV